MEPIDKRNRLDDEPFSYRVAKNNTIFLDYLGKQVKMLKGMEAEKLLQKIKAAQDSKEVQLILAKITGNFKRGNERLGKTCTAKHLPVPSTACMVPRRQLREHGERS